MTLKQKLPVSYLLFTTRGRINRLTYWTTSVFIWTTFYVLYNALAFLFSAGATFFVYPLLFWALFATATKRLHDTNRSGTWLWLILIPVLGPLLLVFLLGIRRGNHLSNRFGTVPGSAPDYFTTPVAATDATHSGEIIVNDVTQLNPVPVAKVVVPRSIEELCQVIRDTDGPVCIGGGRFSMGGQTASPQAVHIDMRSLNKVLDFSPAQKTIHVEAGIRWCDIQHYIDTHDLSVKVMQTYANFTVGGALSVNCHGRYIGLGPVILTVRSLDVVLANGELVHTSPNERPELFFASIGCYNAVAVIARVELDLAENVAVRRSNRKMAVHQYRDFFIEEIRNKPGVVFHNGDIYPPMYTNIRAVSWTKTDKRPTTKTRLMPLAAAYPLERYFMGAFAKSRFGKWRREYLIDPLVFAAKKIHWRNYEAGYDVLELEPGSRKDSTYVLQEYFVPVAQFEAFVAQMSGIFNQNKVNVINVSVRHAKPDSGSLLAWAREEVFAFVVWYKQGTGAQDREKVAGWTREMIDAVLSFSGTYYLPYQAHATDAQFHAAYPEAKRLFQLKQELDPTCKFRNILWDTYFKTK